MPSEIEPGLMEMAYCVQPVSYSALPGAIAPVINPPTVVGLPDPADG